jgi:alkylhydroperoxidase/carboxymuconolactone decarboxylase family protein YurZ
MAVSEAVTTAIQRMTQCGNSVIIALYSFRGSEMAEYQSPDDMRFAKQLIGFAPVEAEAFFKLKSVTERSDGVIPAKYRELIALAVALTT